MIVAEQISGAKMYELVKVGWDKLLGVIIRLEGDTASIQCYEDTCKQPHLFNALQPDSQSEIPSYEQVTRFQLSWDPVILQSINYTRYFTKYLRWNPETPANNC